MNTRLVIADDHPLLLAGIQNFIEDKGFKVCEVVQDGNQAFNAIVKHQPDLAILDWDMPNLTGIEVAKTCQTKGFSLKIIILTLHKQEAIIKEIGQSIHGYILKDDALDELEQCITKVNNNQTYISQKITQSIHMPRVDKDFENLTTSEIKVLKYLANNLTSAEISELLFISKRTVEKHRSNIIKKLQLKSSQSSLLLWVKNHPELFNT